MLCAANTCAYKARWLYLTVTGLSAELGDDGQVGRGNRVNGLITPGRPMSLEAAAGKNPVAHVGKIYNVLAMEMARAICADVNGVAQASVQILSAIGKPVAQPQFVASEVAMDKRWVRTAKAEIRKLVSSQLERVGQVSERLIRGELQVF
jgi:S-adenosylmethionine synthetase